MAGYPASWISGTILLDTYLFLPYIGVARTISTMLTIQEATMVILKFMREQWGVNNNTYQRFIFLWHYSVKTYFNFLGCFQLLVGTSFTGRGFAALYADCINHRLTANLKSIYKLACLYVSDPLKARTNCTYCHVRPSSKKTCRRFAVGLPIKPQEIKKNTKMCLKHDCGRVSVILSYVYKT